VWASKKHKCKRGTKMSIHGVKPGKNIGKNHQNEKKGESNRKQEPNKDANLSRMILRAKIQPRPPKKKKKIGGGGKSWEKCFCPASKKKI